MADVARQAEDEGLTAQHRLELQTQLNALRDSIARNAEQDWGRTLFAQDRAVPEPAGLQPVSDAVTESPPGKIAGQTDHEINPSPIPVIDVSTAVAARAASQAVEGARQQLGEFRVRVEQILGHLEASVSNLRMATESYTTGKVRLVNDSFLSETLGRIKAQVQEESSRAINTQANAHPGNVLVLLRPEK